MISGILVFIFTISVISALIYSVRIPLRHLVRNQREKQVGPLVWSRLISEGRNRDTGRDSRAQTQAVKSFLTNLRGEKYMSRPTASIIWHKEPDSGTVYLYVGLSQSHAEGSNSVANLAREINCRVELVDGPPKVNPKNLSIAYRQVTQPGGVEDAPDRLGKVAESLASNREASGSIILTVEAMRNSEQKRFVTHFIEETILRGGQSVENSSAGITSKSQVMTSAASRMSVGACSDSGVYEDSANILRAALGNVNTLGYNFMTKRPGAGIVARAAILNIFLTALVWLSVFVGFPVSAAIGLTIPLVGVLIYLLAFSHFSSDIWFEQRAMKGEIAVPAFLWASPRFWVHGLIRKNFRKDAGSDKTMGNLSANPSNHQVFTGYGSSVTEFISVPDSYQATDVSSDGVPRIPLSSELLMKDGLFLGKDGSWSDVFYDLKDLPFGAFVAGAQGSGKTNMLLTFFGFVSRASMGNSCGLKINPIWAETKGQGAYDAWGMVRDNPKAVFIDAHNPSSKYRLALEGRRLSEGASPQEVITNSEALVSALQFAFGDGIKAESRQGLDYSIRIAMLLTEDELGSMEIDHLIDIRKPNVIELAYIVMGGNPQHEIGPALLKLAEEYEGDIATDPRKAKLYEAIITLSDQFDPKDALRKRAQEKFAPPKNKLSDLRNAKTFWTPDHRIDLYIPDLVNQFAPVVLNMGPYWKADEVTRDGMLGAFYSSFSTIVSKNLLKAFVYSQWNYIKAYCSGWEDQGKMIPLFFDEVKDISQDSASDDMPNVMAEVGQQGRSRGCGIFAATQFPSQIPESARNEVLAFRTKIWFGLHLDKDVEIAFRSLTFGEDESGFNFTRKNLDSLPDGIAIASIKRGDQISRPFTLMTAYSQSVIPYIYTSDTAVEAIARHDEDGGTYTKKNLKPPRATQSSFSYY